MNLQISSLSPSHAHAGDPALPVVVHGSGFTSQTVALWNGAARATVVHTELELAFTVTAEDLAEPRTVPVAVLLTGGVQPSGVLVNDTAQSNNLPFTIEV